MVSRVRSLSLGEAKATAPARKSLPPSFLEDGLKGSRKDFSSVQVHDWCCLGAGRREQEVHLGVIHVIAGRARLLGRWVLAGSVGPTDNWTKLQ